MAFSTLVGTVIGAGIFAVPYVVAQAGLTISLLYFIVLGSMVWMLHLMVGEVVLRTHDTHRLIGYGKMYLGKWGGIVFTFTTLFAIIGALLAYIVIGGTFLQSLVSPLFDITGTQGSLVIWGFLSFFIVRGIQMISKMELIMNAALFAAVGVILFLSLPLVSTDNVPVTETSNAFLPFGVLLFAFVGWAAIPEITDLLKESKDRKDLKKVIGWAAVASTLLYLLFAAVVVGVTGDETTEDAFLGLVPFLGEGIISLGMLFGLLAVSASYLVLGNYLKNSLRHDYGIAYAGAAAIAVTSPIILFFLGVREFIDILATVGGIALSIEGVAILALFWKARKKGAREPEYEVSVPRVVMVAAAVVLALGAISQIVQ